MKREILNVGSYYHVIKRGVRGSPIVMDDSDRWRFLLMLYHFNDSFSSENWFRTLTDLKIGNSFCRPESWPDRKPLVEIMAFCLLDNHFHLLLKEINVGGISLFMKKLGVGMAKYYNEKYKQKGSLFQGAYKLKIIEDDVYLRYVSAYIMIKNSFELYPDKDLIDTKNFEKVFEWAGKYPYCSLMDYLGFRKSPILDKDILGDIFKNPKDLKSFSKDFILGRKLDFKFEHDENE